MKSYKCLFGFHDYEYSASHRRSWAGKEWTDLAKTCRRCGKITVQEIRGHFILSGEHKKIESVQINKEVEMILREE